jgi:hypothetical protein
MEETEDFEQITDTIKVKRKTLVRVTHKIGLKLHMLSLYHHKTMGTLVDELVADLWSKEKDLMMTKILPKK